MMMMMMQNDRGPSELIPDSSKKSVIHCHCKLFTPNHCISLFNRRLIRAFSSMLCSVCFCRPNTLHIGTSLTFFKNMIVPCESPPNLHLATSEMRCWSGRREILTELSLCYSIVYQCNVAEWYEQFLQVGRLGQALILPGIALYLPSTSIFLLYGAIYTVVQKKRANFGGL